MVENGVEKMCNTGKLFNCLNSKYFARKVVEKCHERWKEVKSHRKKIKNHASEVKNMPSTMRTPKSLYSIQIVEFPEPLMQLAIARPDSSARSMVVAKMSSPHFMASVRILAIASFASMTRRPSWIGSIIPAVFIVISPWNVHEKVFTHNRLLHLHLLHSIASLFDSIAFIEFESTRYWLINAYLTQACRFGHKSGWWRKQRHILTAFGQ